MNSTVLSILVIEDLAMVIYLPVVAGALIGEGPLDTTLSILVALSAVIVVLVVAARFGEQISRVVASESAELLLLTVLGLALVVAGIAQEAQVSAAVGAFLVGVSLSGQVAHQGRAVLEPLRDLFAGIFFVFFGLQVDPADLPAAALPAVVLAVVTGATKVWTGWWAAGRAGIGQRGRLRAGTILLPRGEFAIVIAGLGVASGQTDDLGAVTACYVIVLVVAGPLLAQHADSITDWLTTHTTLAATVEKRRRPDEASERSLTAPASLSRGAAEAPCTRPGRSDSREVASPPQRGPRLTRSVDAENTYHDQTSQNRSGKSTAVAVPHSNHGMAHLGSWEPNVPVGGLCS